MKKHDKDKTRILEYIYIRQRLYLCIKFILYLYYIIFFCTAILFHISKASIDRKTNKQQTQNSMGKILITGVVRRGQKGLKSPFKY